MLPWMIHKKTQAMKQNIRPCEKEKNTYLFFTSISQHNSEKVMTLGCFVIEILGDFACKNVKYNTIYRHKIKIMDMIL